MTVCLRVSKTHRKNTHRPTTGQKPFALPSSHHSRITVTQKKVWMRVSSSSVGKKKVERLIYGGGPQRFNEAHSPSSTSQNERPELEGLVELLGGRPLE